MIIINKLPNLLYIRWLRTESASLAQIESKFEIIPGLGTVTYRVGFFVELVFLFRCVLFVAMCRDIQIGASTFTIASRKLKPIVKLFCLMLMSLTFCCSRIMNQSLDHIRIVNPYLKKWIEWKR